MVDILRERMNGAGEGAGGLSGQEDAEEPAGFLRREQCEKEGREKDERVGGTHAQSKAADVKEDEGKRRGASKGWRGLEAIWESFWQ